MEDVMDEMRAMVKAYANYVKLLNGKINISFKDGQVLVETSTYFALDQLADGLVDIAAAAMNL
jgi:hypothetical protein